MKSLKFNLDSDLSADFQLMLEMAKPSDATSSYLFKWDYLLSSIMSKHPGFGGTETLRHDRAVKKLLDANDHCGYINRMGYADNSYSMKAVLARAATICSSVLGDFSWDVIKGARFTSGSTTSRTKKHGDPYYKYHNSLPIHVTERCAAVAKTLIMLTPVWRDSGALNNIKYVTGGTVQTVPKNAEINRAIEQQPDLNAMIQKGFGLSLDSRLARVGIDLHDQSTNQALAWIGSSDDSLATIDLSSASDSISLRLFRDLIPPIWADALEMCRVPSGTVTMTGLTQDVTWELYATMGNGTTFGIETLIFYSLAKAVMEESGFHPEVGTNLAIYGDDIIVPSACADRLIWVLSSVGFKTNISKTFCNGPFRESCGEHYHNGSRVTPIYIKDRIDNLERVIWFLNALRKWAFDSDLGLCDPSVYNLWKHIRRKYVPSDFLGGDNIESVSQVYSPLVRTERLCLGYESTKYSINNWRAYLRWFQYQSEVTDVRYVRNLTVQDKLHWIVQVTEPQELTRLHPDKVKAYKVDTPLDLRREYLFPQEVLFVNSIM